MTSEGGAVKITATCVPPDREGSLAHAVSKLRKKMLGIETTKQARVKPGQKLSFRDREAIFSPFYGVVTDSGPRQSI